MPCYKGKCARCNAAWNTAAFAARRSGRSLASFPNECFPYRSSVNSKVCEGCSLYLRRLFPVQSTNTDCQQPIVAAVAITTPPIIRTQSKQELFKTRTRSGRLDSGSVGVPTESPHRVHLHTHAIFVYICYSLITHLLDGAIRYR
jgi:hypothetical protein